MSQNEEVIIPGLLGPPVGYVDLLDYHLLEKQAKDSAKPRDRNPLRPSSAGFCARKLAYEFNEYRGNARYAPEEREPKLIRLLNLGHSIEWNLLRMFGDVEFFKVRYQQQALSFFKITEKELIEGSIDFVLYSAEHRVIGDVKSKGDKYSSYSESKWNETDEKLRRMRTVQQISNQAYWVEDLPAFLEELNDPFFSDNFVQLNLYANNPFIQERGIDHAIIVQYNKNDSRLREVRFKPSKEVYDYVQDKFTRITKIIDEHKDPELVEKEYVLGSMRCAFCQFKEHCWPEADAKRAFFKTLPEKDWPRDTDRLGAVGDELERLFAQYTEANEATLKAKPIEERIAMTMKAANVRKVRLANKEVYEVRYFKTPKPHLAVRRAKA